MCGRVFPASRLRGHVDAVNGLSGRRQVCQRRASIKWNGGRFHIGGAIGRRSNGEHRIAVGADTEIINVPRPHWRHGKGIRAWEIEVRIRSVVFRILRPIPDVAGIASGAIAGRQGIAQMHDHIARLLAEAQVEAPRQGSGQLHSIISPVPAGHQLVREFRTVHGKLHDIADREPEPITRIRVAGGAHRGIPKAGLQFGFHLSVQRHPVGVFGGVRKHRPIVNSARDAAGVVIERGRGAEPQVEIRIAAERLQLRAQ